MYVQSLKNVAFKIGLEAKDMGEIKANISWAWALNYLGVINPILNFRKLRHKDMEKKRILPEIITLVYDRGRMTLKPV